jgi:hypothetical protein
VGAGTEAGTFFTYKATARVATNDVRLVIREGASEWLASNRVSSVIPFRFYSRKTGGISLPLRTASLTSLQRHAACPLRVTSLIANRYHSCESKFTPVKTGATIQNLGPGSKPAPDTIRGPGRRTQSPKSDKNFGNRYNSGRQRRRRRNGSRIPVTAISCDKVKPHTNCHNELNTTTATSDRTLQVFGKSRRRPEPG